MSRWVIIPHAALLTLSSLPNHRQSRLACSRPPLLRALTASSEPRSSTLRSYLTRSSRRQKKCWRSHRCVCVEQQKFAHRSALLLSQKLDHVFPPFGVKTCRAHLFHILSQNVSRASFPHQAHPHILSGRGGAEVKELRRHLARYIPHDAHTPDAA